MQQFLDARASFITPTRTPESLILELLAKEAKEGVTDEPPLDVGEWDVDGWQDRLRRFEEMLRFVTQDEYRSSVGEDIYALEKPNWTQGWAEGRNGEPMTEAGMRRSQERFDAGLPKRPEE